ncbi:hypothetical protein FA13DRAFT_1856756 [Coprinellus micaceus]|uniref:Uncharacterized protein n=1 Tax=Coprinellus micaceus TaxID=71717 RepID=A0A4Y7T9V5_COPMI|nr:hypothetical protein FA13DRAFT_1856756 [Coprinellus micaceus]
MSYSTTATSKFLASRYSRSYPQKLHKSQAPVPEWQHFTNPTIYVVLDKTTKAPKGDLESLRLRVLWVMNEGNQEEPLSTSSQTSQPPEDLDLFSFSDIENNLPRRQHSEGLPLKAVCRDTLVGLRYLFSRPDAPQPIYRRFQVTFGSSKDATDFVQAIKSVCPCKTLAAAVPLGTQLLNSGPTIAPPPVRSKAAPASRAQVDLDNDPLQLHAMRQQHTLQGQLSQLMGPPPFIPTAKSICPPLERHDYNSSFAHSTHQQQQPPSQQPSSSPLTSLGLSANCRNESHISNSQSTSSQQQHHPFSFSSSPVDAMLSSLREATGLYDLPDDGLEHLVARIVREDGFIRLMERLSSMWRIRSLVGILVP